MVVCFSTGGRPGGWRMRNCYYFGNRSLKWISWTVFRYPYMVRTIVSLFHIHGFTMLTHFSTTMILINGCLCAVRLKRLIGTKKDSYVRRSLFVISVYGATDRGAGTLKDEFYDEVGSVVLRCNDDRVVIFCPIRVIEKIWVCSVRLHIRCVR